MQRSGEFAGRLQQAVKPVRFFKRMEIDGDQCIDERTALVIGIDAIEMSL